LTVHRRQQIVIIETKRTITTTGCGPLTVSGGLVDLSAVDGPQTTADCNYRDKAYYNHDWLWTVDSGL